MVKNTGPGGKQNCISTSALQLTTFVALNKLRDLLRPQLFFLLKAGEANDTCLIKVFCRLHETMNRYYYYSLCPCFLISC